MSRVISGLPTGHEKTAQVRSMFDAIAPRYDLVNRVMTFGLDLRWRRQAVDTLAVPEGSVILDLACGTGDFLVDPAIGGLSARSASTCRGGCCGPAARMPRSSRATANSCRWPPGPSTRSPAGTHCATSPSSTRSSPRWPEWCGPAGGSASSRSPNPKRGVLRAGHRVWFRRAVPAIGGLLVGSDRLPVPARVDCLPSADAELRGAPIDAGFSAVNRHALSGGLSQLLTATRSGRP